MTRRQLYRERALKQTEFMVYARNRWDFATCVKNNVTGKLQWERRDGSYICNHGDELGVSVVPPRPAAVKNVA